MRNVLSLCDPAPPDARADGVPDVSAVLSFRPQATAAVAKRATRPAVRRCIFPLRVFYVGLLSTL